jgi:hypothetical protein
VLFWLLLFYLAGQVREGLRSESGQKLIDALIARLRPKP